MYRDSPSTQFMTACPLSLPTWWSLWVTGIDHSLGASFVDRLRGWDVPSPVAADSMKASIRGTIA